MIYGRLQEEVECESRCPPNDKPGGDELANFKGITNSSRQITLVPLQGGKDRISQVKKVARR